MSVRTQIAIMICMVIALIALAGMVKKKLLSLRYALPWGALAAGVVLLTCFPALSVGLSRLFGVALPVNMIFFIGFCFLLLIIFTLSMAVSRLSARVKTLAQHQALLEKAIEEMREESKE